MARPLALGLAVALGLGLGACGSEGGGSATETTGGGPGTTGATTTQPATPQCAKVAAPPAKPATRVPRPTLRLNRNRTYRAVVSTSCGSFTITLDVRNSPRTAASFAHLARRDFFDNTTFHRVISGFVIQGGDPQGNGTGGPGYKVVEAPPQRTRYTRGVVAMAKTEAEQPGTSGSQFYVVTGEDAQLPPDYAVLGRVTQGMEVVELISAQPTGPSSDPSAAERPVQPIVIRDVAIQESGA